MENKKISRRRKRRSAEDIEDSVFLATEKLIIEKGFKDVTFTEIMKLAGVEPQVMYRRFDTLEDLFDKFIRRYDYWFIDLVEFNLDEKDPVTSMKNILTGLANSLYKNPIMQQILIWEVADGNKLTNRIALNRELHSASLLEFFRSNLPKKVDFDCFTSLLIGGIYYLIIRRERSTFCEIDFDKVEGSKLLTNTIEQLINTVYKSESTNTQIEEVALSLLQQGVDENVISISTKLPIQTINKIKQKIKG
ncbi:MAG: TetR/AcrR family transcriptional regulator [Dysgonomonas sp.]|uniref:TetR/AcrR family transcriptional regulator n=1 Tax=Dysgonomonas sp. TaxID=1891233 RepID=UPI003A8860F1